MTNLTTVSCDYCGHRKPATIHQDETDGWIYYAWCDDCLKAQNANGQNLEPLSCEKCHQPFLWPTTVKPDVHRCLNCRRKMVRCEHCKKMGDPLSERLKFCSHECLDAAHQIVLENRAKKFRNDLPRKYQRFTDPNRAPNPSKAVKVMELGWDNERDRFPNLWAFGGSGTGKTSTVFLKAEQMLLEGQIVDVTILRGSEFQDAVVRHVMKEEEESLAEWMGALCETDLLIIDDFHKITFSKRTASELHGLIEYRDSHDSPTFFTTGKTVPQMIAQMDSDGKKDNNQYGAEIMRRVTECCVAVNFNEMAATNIVPLLSPGA